MKLRRLYSSGLDKMIEFLDTLVTEPQPPFPENLLEDPEYSEQVKPEVEIKVVEFKDRFAVAEYLFKILSEKKIEGLERDKGLWAWLSLLYFEQLCPPA